MQNRLNGDGDAVAIWGRCQKEDPADGINNSDTCAIHSAVYNESKGSGLIMASEHWAIVGENGGTEQTNGTPAGATICQHVKAFSSKGMAHAGILISGGMDNYPYGMWNAIQISRGAFMRNGSMDGIPGDRDIDGDGLVAVEGTGEFTGKAFRAETEHFFRRQMLDRGHAVLQFKDAPRIFFTGGDARLGLAGEALADIDRDSRGFFFDFQGSTLPSETFSQRCIPCTEQAAVRR